MAVLCGLTPTGSLAEQVGVCAGSIEVNGATVNPVDQQPIGFDVYITPWLPVALQRVVTQGARQWLAGEQQIDNVAQFFHILAAFFCTFYVAFELTGIAG